MLRTTSSSIGATVTRSLKAGSYTSICILKTTRFVSF